MAAVVVVSAEVVSIAKNKIQNLSRYVLSRVTTGHFYFIANRTAQDGKPELKCSASHE